MKNKVQYTLLGVVIMLALCSVFFSYLLYARVLVKPEWLAHNIIPLTLEEIGK